LEQALSISSTRADSACSKLVLCTTEMYLTSRVAASAERDGSRRQRQSRREALTARRQRRATGHRASRASHRRPRVAVIHYQCAEFCTNPQRNPENVRLKYIERVPSRGPPLIHALRRPPSWKKMPCFWTVLKRIPPEASLHGGLFAF
jgi:hypothetical protein